MNIISDYIQLFDFLNLPAGEVRYHKDKGGGVGGPHNRIGLQRGFRNLVKLFICGLPHSGTHIERQETVSQTNKIPLLCSSRWNVRKPRRCHSTRAP